MLETYKAREILTGEYEGKQVLVRGWVYRIIHRDGTISWVIRDGTGFIQAKIDKELYNKASKIGRESAVKIGGTVFSKNKTPQIRISSLEVLSPSENYPSPEEISKLENRHLQVREQKKRATIIIMNTAVNAIRDYLNKEGFTEIFPSTITKMAAEDPTTLFGLRYFDQTAYLSQTVQPYLEALLPSLEKVWSLVPTYRKEEKASRKHLSEFWTVEIQQAYSNLDDTIRLNEELFSETVRTVADVNSKELETLGRDLSTLYVKPPLKRITYDEAIKILDEAQKIEIERGKKFKVEWGRGFDLYEEDILCEVFGVPFFVTGYPVRARPFYMKPDPERANITKSFDLFAPISGEVATGSEVITDYELLRDRIIKKELPPLAYKWYVDLRKFGVVERSGLGMGLERALMYITGLPDIKDVSLFPRVYGESPIP